MPIVFAIQNPQAALPLILDVEWYIKKLGSSDDPLAASFIDLSWANFSTDPYFVVLSTNQLNNTEGSFGLLWVLHSGNCSVTPPRRHPTGLKHRAKQHQVYDQERRAAAEPSDWPEYMPYGKPYLQRDWNIAGYRPYTVWRP